MAKATYYIAQHISDIFRNEPRNIGVLVELNGERQTRFLGETDTGEIDGRRLKSFFYPNVYRQWITYWKKALQTDSIASIVKANQANYRIIEGGEVGDIGQDSLDQISEYLYSILVSEGRYLEATTEDEDVQTQPISLENEVFVAFRDFGLLNENEVRHPLKKNRIVEGETTFYKPTYSQENGQLYIIEMIDFTQQVKSRPRDHAGYSAFMYKDIQNKRNIEPISVIKVREEEREIEEVKTGLLILEKTSRIIDWSSLEQKQEFLDERKAIAYSTNY